ncbi:MAG: class I SAM-dependent methyltransferase [Nitrospirae bacterium]|nr:class I SAM-dependent methyltransferase [Nitrospirota bacterium]
MLSISEVFSLDDYKMHVEKYQREGMVRLSFENSLLPDTQTEFVFNGYCYVCGEVIDFLVDFNYSYSIGGVLIPNWRERLVCPVCHLNNRMRATVHIFEQECQPNRCDSKIYITEQTTPLYNWFSKNYTHICGSEYLGDCITFGSYNGEGIRNENITKLSFPDAEFDYILSFDVFEHIPDYKKALKQCFRCLKPNAVLLFSIPFAHMAQRNIIRSYVSENGEVKHILPPEYHGDPLSFDGCLCFYHFGWEILTELNTIGFKDAKALLYWSREYGYLGGEQIIFTASKPA